MSKRSVSNAGSGRPRTGPPPHIFLLVVLCLLPNPFACRGGNHEPAEPPAGAAVDATAIIEGQRYHLIRGAVYRVDSKSGARTFVKRLYQPGFYERNYRTIDGTIYRITPDNGKRYAVRRSLSDGFEQAKTVHDLIGPEREWTSLTLQGPASPTVADYIKLRKEILGRRSGFLDVRVEPSADRAHTGRQALRLYAVPPSPNMMLTKASLDTELFHYVQGDHFWFSGWFYLQQGRPTTIVDLECSLIAQGPGMRVLLTKQLRPYLELKWINKPKYSPTDPNVTFPRRRWVHVKVHFVLSGGDDGVARLWLDGKKVIDGRGRTLPFKGVVYDRLQLGITANPKDTTTVLYVDDVIVSDKPVN